MATRVQPTAHDADNNVGTACGAARNDWRSADADSMSARDNTIPLQMPDIRLQATTRSAITPDCFSYLREESIYQLLGNTRAFKCRENPDRLAGLPVNFIRYYTDKFGDYIALRPVEEPNALPPIRIVMQGQVVDN